MKLSKSWLNDFVDLDGISDSELGLRLTLSTAEIEGIESAKESLKDLVIGFVETRIPHPNADKLSCCKVRTSENDLHDVVCGAPNVAAGQKIVFAPVGACLPGNFKIEKRKIRGEISCGMICSETELGIGNDQSGIMVLPDDAPTGGHFIDYQQLDTLYDIDNKSLTNRPDLWGVYGFAREVAAIYQRDLTPLTSFDITRTVSDNPSLQITIDSSCTDQRLCRRYLGILIDNITVQSSPVWLQKRLIAIGSRPINNIVDLTNYVMFETGQPFHAFDRNLLKNNEINIRLAQLGECITTLDDKEYKLTNSMMVIADQSSPVAIAGVMGGKGSEISVTTQTIVLEIANFHPANIRRTSTALGIRTDSSERFEKSLDPYSMTQAANRFVELLIKIDPSIKILEYHDVGNYRRDIPPIEISTREINKKLGVSLENDRIIGILKALQFDVSAQQNDLTITIPTFRATKDISIKADIVEEIGRIFGYDNITPRSPNLPPSPPERNAKHQLKQVLKHTLSFEFGFHEIENYSFTTQAIIEKAQLQVTDHIELQNAASKDYCYLTTDLIPTLLSTAQLNLRYYQHFRIYEIGNIFTGTMQESTICAGLVVTNEKPGETNAFFRLREQLESLFTRINLSGYQPKVAATPPPYAHPSRTIDYMAANQPMGSLGEIHPKITKAFGITQKVLFFTFDLAALLVAPHKKNIYKSISKYPAVLFDVAILTPKDTPAAEIQKLIKKAVPEFIQQVTLFDEYRGDKIPPDQKSLAFKVIFGSMKETLSTQKVRESQDKIISDLAKKGFDLRPG